MVNDQLLAGEDGRADGQRPALWRGFEVLGHVEEPRGGFCQLAIRPGEGALFLMIVEGRARPRTARGPAPATSGELASAVVRFAQECLFSIPAPSLRRLDPGALLVDLDVWLADSGLGTASAVVALLESRGPPARPAPDSDSRRSIVGHVRGARAGPARAQIVSLGPRTGADPGLFDPGSGSGPHSGAEALSGCRPGAAWLGSGEVLPRSFGDSLTASTMLRLTGGESEVRQVGSEGLRRDGLEAEELAAGGSRAARSRMRTGPAARALISCRPARRRARA